jgi:3-oxoacyl-[acyl-carrier protein] reductase
MPSNNISLKGKTALVTGATRGIGKAIASLFKEAGAKVIAVGSKELDLSDGQSIERFLERMEGFGPIHILVNNAGINKIDAIDQINDEDWDRIIQVNLTGARKLMTKTSQIMIRRKIKGHILNISSIFGIVARAKRGSYAASKAGLIGLTKAVALDLAPQGILVNALCPGFVGTDLTRSVLSKKEMAMLSQDVALGRFADVEEIACAALFLCSSKNTYITGQAIVADGGYIAR